MNITRRFYFLISLLFGFILLYLSFKSINYSDLYKILITITTPYIILIFIINLLDMAFRSFKWSYVTGLDYRGAFESISLGSSLNTILPLRLGDIYRSYYLRDQLGFGNSLSKTIIERAIEGLVLVFLLYISIINLDVPSVIVDVLNYSTVIFSLLLVVILLMQYRNYSLFGLRFTGISPLFVINLVFLTFFMWVVNFFTIYIISISMGLNLGIYQLILLLCVLNLSFLMPTGSGGLGILEYSSSLVLSSLGYSFESGLAIALILRGVITSTSILIIFVYYKKIIHSFSNDKDSSSP